MRSNQFLGAALSIVSAIGCVETTVAGSGTIVAAITTTGGDQDDSYFLYVGREVREIAPNATLKMYREPDIYSVLLDAVAENCLVDGANPRQVRLGDQEEVRVEFLVDCAMTGVEVRTQTNGDYAPMNYVLEIDGRAAGPIAINGSTIVSRIKKGQHALRLKMPGTNCASAPDTELAVDIENRTVTPVAFAVVCKPPVRPERIAFVHDTTAFNVFGTISLINPDGSVIVRLGPGASPSWSPKGDRLVFSTYGCDFYYGCSGDLQIVDPEVAQTGVIAEGLRPVSPRWNPVSDIIAFVNHDTEALYLINAFSRADFHQVVVEGVSRVRNPAWSPNGVRIAAGCIMSGANYDICAFDMDGTNVSRLTNDAGAEVEPAWSPDGNSIAFTSSLVIGGETTIFVMASDGTGQRKLTAGFSPAWSRDGLKIVFARGDGLFTIRPDGSELTRLTNGKDYAPAWRP